MICKGNTHKSGAKLARYLTTGKDQERAELWELRGFAADNIRDAFRSVHIMAEGTKCEQPFFHVQVRNPIEDRHLTREEWRLVADRIEAKLGLTGQPRALVFHTDEITGEVHLHAAWSRIDADTLTARPLPFFKERLKDVARQLERELDLTRVKNERDGPVKAPDRDEFEQARRLGVDIRQVRQTIRECWDRSDCGRSFEAALADEGMALAKGDRRDYVVLDDAGGLHALGKRIIGLSAAEIRARMADLDPRHLPAIEQAREQLQRAAWDRDRADRNWQEAVNRAGIERAGAERVPVRIDATEPALHLRGDARHIWSAYNNSPDAEAFQNALSDRGLHLARVTDEDARHSHTLHWVARRHDQYSPVLRQGEYVVLGADGRGYRLTERTTGTEPRDVRQFMQALDATPFPSVRATRMAIEERRVERVAAASIRRDADPQSSRAMRDTARAANRILHGAASPLNSLGRMGGKALEITAGAFDSLLAPRLTPEQKREGERTTRIRSAEAEDHVDLSRYLAQRELEQRRREEERAATRQRDRDHRER